MKKKIKKKAKKPVNSFAFREMKKGDTFFVPLAKSPVNHVRCYAYQAMRRMPGKFSVKMKKTQAGKLLGCIVTRSK